jgi:hypothetical protein
LYRNDEAAPLEAVTNLLFGIALFGGFGWLYFLPSIVESKHRKGNRAMFVLNLFLSWTLIGWAIAMIWAKKRG